MNYELIQYLYYCYSIHILYARYALLQNYNYEVALLTNSLYFNN